MTKGILSRPFAARNATGHESPADDLHPGSFADEAPIGIIQLVTFQVEMT
jgi:hypothetical protein